MFEIESRAHAHTLSCATGLSLVQTFAPAQYAELPNNEFGRMLASFACAYCHRLDQQLHRRAASVPLTQVD